MRSIEAEESLLQILLSLLFILFSVVWVGAHQVQGITYQYCLDLLVQGARTTQ